MLSTLYGIYFPFWMHFEMSSAICFNLDQSKILLSGNGLTDQKNEQLTLSQKSPAFYVSEV